jgi:hypothetical protein
MIDLKAPQFRGEYHLADGTRWFWSVTYFDEEDDGGMTGYHAEVRFQYGAVQMQASAMVITGSTSDAPLDLAEPTVFYGREYPTTFEITLPMAVGKGLADAILSVCDLVGAQ